MSSHFHNQVTMGKLHTFVVVVVVIVFFFLRSHSKYLFLIISHAKSNE